MNRSDRLFLETQVRHIDETMRTLIDMKSVLTRRIRRMESEMNNAPRPLQPPRRREHPNPPSTQQQTIPEVIPLLDYSHVQPPRRRQNVNIIPDTIQTTIKTIKKSESNKILADECGICREQHTKVDTETCNCSHTFGKTCFTEWRKKCVATQKPVTCPICRTETTTLEGYRSRTYTKKTKPVVEASNTIVLQPEVICISDDEQDNTDVEEPEESETNANTIEEQEEEDFSRLTTDELTELMHIHFPRHSRILLA